MAKLKIGKKAPAFTLENQKGKEVSLSDFEDKWVVLYFYPKDNTPGCTVEAKDFTALKRKFSANKATVLGVSKDSVHSHCKFIDKQKLSVQLLSDPDTKMQKSYGVWRKKKFMGREFMGTVRSTFLIDPKGKVAAAWDNVKVKNHAEEVLERLKELRAGDK